MQRIVPYLVLLVFLISSCGPAANGVDVPNPQPNWYDSAVVWIIIGLVFLGGLLWLRNRSRSPTK